MAARKEKLDGKTLRQAGGWETLSRVAGSISKALRFIICRQFNYCRVTNTRTMPLPSLKPVMALPRIAPAARAWSLTFIA